MSEYKYSVYIYTLASVQVCMCRCVGGRVCVEISGMTVCSFQLTMHRECRHHSSCSEWAPWGCIADGSETHMFHTCGWQRTGGTI